MSVFPMDKHELAYFRKQQARYDHPKIIHTPEMLELDKQIERLEIELDRLREPESGRVWRKPHTPESRAIQTKLGQLGAAHWKLLYAANPKYVEYWELTDE